MLLNYNCLYNNTCSSCIFIGRELCVIKVHTHGWRQLMVWSNLANLLRGSSHDFCQLYYNIKQIDFIFLCFCTVIDHRWRHSVWRTKSHGTQLRLVRTFLFFTRHDIICDLLQYRRAQKWNLFVNYSIVLFLWCFTMTANFQLWHVMCMFHCSSPNLQPLLPATIGFITNINVWNCTDHFITLD